MDSGMESQVSYNTPAGSSITVTLANASDNSTDSGATPEHVYRIYCIVGSIQAIIAIIGIIFNALNIYVLVNLVRRRRDLSPTYHLLIAMGVADLMVLFFVSWYTLSVYVRKKPLLFTDLAKGEYSDYYHVLHYLWTFPINPFSIASNWLVVATTVFRFLAVVFPMKVCQWCTLKRMRVSIVLIFIFALLVNVIDWTKARAYMTADGNVRVEDTDMYFKLKPYYFVYHVLEVYLPFTIDFVLVIFLIINLNNTTSSLADSIQDDNAAARERERRKISVMLIAIVLWFLLCYIPVVIYQIMRDTSDLGYAVIEEMPFFLTLGVIKDFGPLLNHAGNIVFYCLCNNTYRRMFVNTLLRRKKTSQHTTMTQVSSRTGKRFQVPLRRSIINKMGKFGIFSPEETRRESVLWNKLGLDPLKSKSQQNGYDSTAINILVSDPLIEMYHQNNRSNS